MIIEDTSLLRLIRDAGKIHREIIDELFRSWLLSVWHTGREVEDWIIRAQKKRGVESAFLGQYGFPANIILSIDHVAVHGVPDEKEFKSWQVVKVDYGVRYKGYLTDAATTIIMWEAKNPRHIQCMQAARSGLQAGIDQAITGKTLGDIWSAVESRVVSEGFYIIKNLSWHGLGKKIHENPYVYNYWKAGKGEKLKRWLYIAIEPIVGLTTGQVVETDNFAICMKDGNIWVQEEHCGIVGDDGFEIIA